MKKLLMLPLTLLIASQASFAAPNSVMKPLHHNKAHRLHKPAHHRMYVLQSWRKSMRPTKNISEAQAKTLTQAAIILYGDDTMQVKSINTVKNHHGKARYLIKIVNNRSKKTQNIMMNPRNGLMHHARSNVTS